jgi:hypothetical protein
LANTFLHFRSEEAGWYIGQAARCERYDERYWPGWKFLCKRPVRQRDSNCTEEES